MRELFVQDFAGRVGALSVCALLPIEPGGAATSSQPDRSLIDRDLGCDIVVETR
jgi:hypothetical protein